MPPIPCSSAMATELGQNPTQVCEWVHYAMQIRHHHARARPQQRTPHASPARAHRLGRVRDHAHVRDFPRANETTLPQAATSPSTDLVCEAGVMMW